MTYKEARKTFFIYKCLAKRDDGSEIVRILKIQSYFDIADLALVLTTMSDAAGLIDKVVIKYEDYDFEFKYDMHELIDGISFFELDNRNLTIEIVFKDDISNVYQCEYVGMDIQTKNITRKTPICVYANGFSRFGAVSTRKKELKIYDGLGLDLNKYINDDSIYNFQRSEKMKLEWAINDLKRLFNLEKESNYSAY